MLLLGFKTRVSEEPIVEMAQAAAPIEREHDQNTIQCPTSRREHLVPQEVAETGTFHNFTKPKENSISETYFN